jgi:hypothetical protein
VQHYSLLFQHGLITAQYNKLPYCVFLLWCDILCCVLLSLTALLFTLIIARLALSLNPDLQSTLCPVTLNPTSQPTPSKKHTSHPTSLLNHLPPMLSSTPSLLLYSFLTPHFITHPIYTSIHPSIHPYISHSSPHSIPHARTRTHSVSTRWPSMKCSPPSTPLCIV